MINKNQAQVIANAINTLANVLAKPTHESWRQASFLESTIDTLLRVRSELEELSREENR